MQLECTCGHALLLHDRSRDESLDSDAVEEALKYFDDDYVRTPLKLAKECLHYDCVCPDFLAAPLNTGGYVDRGDDFDVCGYEIVSYRETDSLARKCWECKKVIPAQLSRYVVRFFSNANDEDAEYMSTMDDWDEPPTFTDVVMCVDCVHIEVAFAN